MSTESNPIPAHQSQISSVEFGMRWLLAFAFFAVLGYCTLVGVSNQGPGDFTHFYNSGVALKVGDSLYLTGDQQPVPPYTELGGAYIYPPFLAFVFRPFAEMSFGVSKDIWVVLSMIALGVCAFFLASKQARLFGVASSKATALTSISISGLAIFFLFDTIIAQAKLAQTDVFLFLWITLAYLVYSKRPFLAGLLISVPIAIKYVTIVFLIYFIVRREHKATVGVILGVLIGFFAPALFLGWDQNLAELNVAFSGMLNMLGLSDVESAAGIHGLTWERSIAIPSGFARLAEYAGLGFSMVFVLSAIAAAGCLGVGCLLYKKMGVDLLFRKDRVNGVISTTSYRLVTLEWSLLIITFLIFSPQTTKRHVILLLIPMILACTILLVPMTKQRVTRYPLLVGAFLVMLGTIFPPADAESAIATWRAVSGLSMCIIILAVALIWTTLSIIKNELETAQPVIEPVTPIEPAQ